MHLHHIAVDVKPEWLNISMKLETINIVWFSLGVFELSKLHLFEHFNKSIFFARGGLGLPVGYYETTQNGLVLCYLNAGNVGTVAVNFVPLIGLVPLLCYVEYVHSERIHVVIYGH